LQPSLILDYLYGVAIFQHRGSLEEYCAILCNHIEVNLIPTLKFIPNPSSPCLSPLNWEPDDPNDSDHSPYFDIWELDALQAKDDFLVFSLLLKGVTSEP
jgi:hypothetical protein